MLDIKDLRKNLENFKKKLKERNVDFDVSKFYELDELNRKLINNKEKLEQEKKSLSKSKDKSNFKVSKSISDEISVLTKKQIESQNELNQIMFSLPNVALKDVPVGKDEKSNVLIKIWLDDLNSVQNNIIDLADPRTIEGVQGLELAGVINVGRANQILEL